MKIVIETTKGVYDSYEAQKWVIDESERLHIVASVGGSVASYNRGSWASVRQTEKDLVDGRPVAKVTSGEAG